MKSKKNIRTLLALALLAMYTNVFALNLVCNYSKIFPSHHSHQDHDHNHGQHDHHSHKEHNHGSHHDDNEKGQEQEEDKNNCCNDEAGKIFESVFVTSINVNGFDFTSDGILPVIFSYNPFDYRVSYYSISNYSLPPPKIPDIRIHIQSFQI